MKAALITLFFCLGCGLLHAQLSVQQKVHDFSNLAAVYAKRYAPYEWKKLVVNFDLYELAPWLRRVERSRDDLEFFEICAEYVARLEDAHSSFRMPSSFSADSGLFVDIYDGKVLIDSINRTLLPTARYPFQIGDELTTVDGRPVEQLLEEFSRLFRSGNPRTTRRMLADLLTFRPQSILPRAVELGDSVRFEIRRQSGALETYDVPWVKSGYPIRAVGPVPTPQVVPGRKSRLADTSEEPAPEPAPEPALEPTPEPTPEWMRPLEELWNFRVPHPEDHYVLGWGARNPIFQMPSNFVLRRGSAPTDWHFSGTYEAGGLRIGYLRFRNFAPPPTALAELDTEIAFFRQNTDGLVVDVMRNTGGGCYMAQALQRLIPNRFTFLGEEIRVNLSYINSIYFALESARRARADQWIIDLYSTILDQMVSAYTGNRGRTGPIPICSISFEFDPVRDRAGDVIAYEKPLIVLIDEFSTSAGDMFPASIQDNRRGPLVGWRTTGAGGSVSGWTSGIYSEASTSNTNSLVTRPGLIVTPDYPAAYYIENIGVRPDVELDYMTRDNLLNRGRRFVEDFTGVIVSHVLDSRR